MAWLYRELICYVLFVKSLNSEPIQWRQSRYKLKWGSLAEEV